MAAASNGWLLLVVVKAANRKVCPPGHSQGIVTHVTDVKPLVSVVAYTDPESGFEVYQEVTGRTFKPLDNDAKEVSSE